MALNFALKVPALLRTRRKVRSLKHAQLQVHRRSFSTDDHDHERGMIRTLKSIGGGQVSLHKDATLATITLHNTENRNALAGKMMAELSDIVSNLENDTRCTALILRGDGDFFCSGADLNLARDHLTTGEHGGAMCELMTTTLSRLHNLSMVSVAAVEGAAVGGGAELSTAYDFRVISSSALVQFVQARMGASTGWGGAGRLAALVGRRRALRLLAWAPRLGAREAQDIGLMDEICAAGQTYETAKNFLKPITDADCPEAIRALKKVVSASSFDVEIGGKGERPVAFEIEKEAFKSVWGGPFNRAKLITPSTSNSNKSNKPKK